jgi:hypothetical protein
MHTKVPGLALPKSNIFLTSYIPHPSRSLKKNIKLNPSKTIVNKTEFQARIEMIKSMSSNKFYTYLVLILARGRTSRNLDARHGAEDSEDMRRKMTMSIKWT